MLSKEDMNHGQKRGLLHIMRGKDVFLTGGAGTGKSALISAVLAMLPTDKQVIVCAPTGLAAMHIGGVTIHRAFSFTIGSFINDGGKQRASSVKMRANKLIRNADIIIIDEISMVRMDMMDAILASVAKAEEQTQKHIQLIVVGDFYQLPPVLVQGSDEAHNLSDFYKKDYGKAYAFQGVNWRKRKFYPVVLNETMRQSDPVFIDNLNKARIGDKKCIPYFNQRVLPAPNGIPLLYGRNKDVDTANMSELAKLPGQMCQYQTDVHYLNGYSEATIDPMVKADIPPDLFLKVGARVIMTSNDSPKLGISALLVNGMALPQNHSLFHNGSMGYIEALYRSGADIKLDNGNRVRVMLRQTDIYDYVVNDDTGQIQKVNAGYYLQLPLKLGYAITIHKSQGQTYERVAVSPDTFVAGQMFVDLSRVKTIDGLYLISRIKPRNLQADETVTQFYDSLLHPKKTGRIPINNDGTTRDKLLWVPKPLVQHVRDEVEKNHPIRLKYSPVYSREREHIRVPSHLYEHIKSEIADWKKTAKRV